MNQEAQELLEKILKKELVILSKTDKAFLRARKDYLTEEQLQKYANVLGLKKKTKE